jgi:hypothetical protein
VAGGHGKDSSFSEEKEAKRLSDLAPASPDWRGGKVGKVFWFFFSKKNMLAFYVR